jgi:hypothetical protein
MRRYHRHFAVRLLISALVAVATPAIAAGLVEGVSATAMTVADATQPQVPDGATPDNSGRMATHGPARLSVLVRVDDVASRDTRKSP